MAKKVAKRMSLRCPRCRKEMQSFTDVWFVEGYLVVFEGQCCGAEITSGELEILSLFPSIEKSEVSH